MTESTPGFSSVTAQPPLDAPSINVPLMNDVRLTRLSSHFTIDQDILITSNSYGELYNTPLLLLIYCRAWPKVRPDVRV
jgi:hypothetical protein